jgi:hypothetical protein
MKKQDDIFDKLDELKEKPPFDVPENYFDTFHVRLKERIETENAENIKPGIIRMLKPLIGLAAGILFIAALYITFFTAQPAAETADNDTEFLKELNEVINDPVAWQLNEFDLVCYLTDCNQPGDTDFDNNNDIDVTGLTAEDIDDLILF